MFLLSGSLYLLLTPCLSRPVLHDGQPATVGWVQDPNGRGTSGLILSCVLTLGLCVWSAMHLNIPPKGETQVQYWVRSIKWVILGVVIPELVVLSAWRQWLSARRMSAELDKIFDEQKEKGAPPRRNKWTIAHSHYAGMGGFVFDSELLPHGDRALFHEPERLTLTASGVLLLAQCGHLPDIDRESIWDKSKADSLAKALVCLQAAWMILQTLGRLVAHEPITLLEVNTLAHIFCAFVIYVLWWRKPKEVHAPTVLEGPWIRPLAAYMYMSSRVSGKKPEGVLVLSSWIKPELAELAWYPGISSTAPSLAVTDCTSTKPTPANRSDMKVKSIDVKHDEIEVDGAGTLLPRPAHSLSNLPPTVVQITTPSAQDRHNERDRQNRFCACVQAISMFPAIRARFQVTPSETWLKPDVCHLVTDSATNWPSDFYLPGISGETMGMALWLSSSLYGGIHIAAWSEFFPTQAERLLWRFSATYIASSGGFWLLLCIIAFRWPFASEYWDRFIELRAWKIEYAVLGFGATVCGIAYIFARVFLVVDAIVSLRRLPDTAYQTPNWTTIWPHF